MYIQDPRVPLSRHTLAVLIACFLGALAAPTPASAQCQNCTFDVLCRDSFNECYVKFECTDRSASVFKTCDVDPLTGLCSISGGHCLLADANRNDPLGIPETSASESVCRLASGHMVPPQPPLSS